MRARGVFWMWAGVAYVLIALTALSACAQYLEQAQPLIVLDPTRGGPGTSVVVSGSGFPPETRVSVRLGPPTVGATPLSYGDADTDADGRFTLSFTMPSHWPDGTLVTETDLVVVVLNQDGSTKATAAFVYLPSIEAAQEPVLGVQETYRELILAWHREGNTGGFCGDVTVYENGYAEISFCKSAGLLERRQLSEEAVAQLHAWVAAYQPFEIEQIEGTDPSRVRTRTTFAGKGARQVSAVELRMFQALLETLVPSS